VRLFRDDLLAGSKETDLSAGDTEVVFENQKSAHDFSVFEAVVEMPGDAVAENNRRRAVAALRGAPLVLVVDPDESRMQPLMGALGELGIETEWRSPEGLPNTLEELERFDLFLLSDVPAVTVGPQRMELYRRWVRDFGGGFLLAGGENSFGAGGYYRTPIEEMLPVQMEHEDRRETPAVALVVVLDRSGSMAARIAGGQTKMSLANQGALYALQVLQPRDWFGLLAVDVQAHTIVPLSRVSGQEGWDRRILSVNAGGGGIYIYTSLAESLRLLRDSEARIKHVILFSDAADAEEKISGEMGGEQMGGSALDLTSAMLASGITTSVVALGREGDRDVLFLRALAERGAGRFYLTGDATTLPQIFTAETLKVSQSSLVEEPFQPVVGTASEITKGIDWSEAPLLLGYNTTKPKPTAEIPLVTFWAGECGGLYE
jgi:Ca-activated chloride channel family protein